MTAKDKKEIETTEQNEPKELDLDKKVTIRNVTTWNTGFARIEGNGDVSLVPKGSVKIQRSELLAQAQSGNKSFNGLDGMGSHAEIYIDDKPTRIELGYEDTKRKQLIFSDALVKEVFAIKNQDEFEERFKQSFVTMLEKFAAVEAVYRLGINDYSKIRFATTYTGVSIEQFEQQ